MSVSVVISVSPVLRLAALLTLPALTALILAFPVIAVHLSVLMPAGSRSLFTALLLSFLRCLHVGLLF